MNEAVFRQRAQELGYGDIAYKNYPPHADGPLHTHEFGVMLLVIEGEFTLARSDEAVTYAPGGVCELAADVMHTERTGSAGARVLLGKRSAPVG